MVNRFTGHVLQSLEDINPEKIVIVVGFKQEKVKDYVDTLNYNNIEYAVQAQQLGTGHACSPGSAVSRGF